MATRHTCLVILLALIIGHASLAAHAATHVLDNHAECELCSSYGDASEAIPSVHEHGIRGGLSGFSVDVFPAVPEMRDVLLFHPRGPPLSN